MVVLSTCARFRPCPARFDLDRDGLGFSSRHAQLPVAHFLFGPSCAFFADSYTMIQSAQSFFAAQPELANRSVAEIGASEPGAC